MLYSIRWERLPFDRRLKANWISVRVSFFDENGRQIQKTREYEEWIGVCTSKIDTVVESLLEYFPSHEIRYVRLGEAKKILPYFEDRLAKGKLEYRSKPFYKLYTTANHEDVGRFFTRYKIGYYEKKDWLVRIYVDLCTRYDTNAFYYRWYEVSDDSRHLMESFRMLPDHTASPDWTIGSFDLETVPSDGATDRIPSGLDPSDRIVMISLFKWNRSKGARKWLLYLLPNGVSEGFDDYPNGFAYASEVSMLRDFHRLIADCQVLTGYNVNGFDIPCLFARLYFLREYSLLVDYSSVTIGMDVVTTFRDKMVLDLYYYFRTFSGYDLPGLKLDDVARVKLKGETKIPIKSTGIWAWYTNNVSTKLMRCDDVSECHRELNPFRVPVERFGTFRTYLDYCLRDAELVYRLFEKEMVLSFLVARANFTALNAESALHFGNSRFLLELFKTYGTRLGFFFNSRFFASPVEASKFQSTFVSRKQTYQGALNFCVSERAYDDVVVMDFTSMYPTALLSANLCYGTCTILARDEWMRLPKDLGLVTIPYRVHSDRDFEHDRFGPSETFSYPPFDPSNDTFAIVVNPNARAFLPCIVEHFLELRKHHQKMWKSTGDVYHYNVQLGIKILINSLYGVMANKDSPLNYLVIAMSIVTLSRYQLLGSYHHVRRMGYDPCYADTDSLMVKGWPFDECDAINAYLNIPHVELKYEQRMKRLVVLSKKRYVYETQDGRIVSKGFQKRINDIGAFISETILNGVWNEMFGDSGRDESISRQSRGWIVWVDTLLRVQYMCRDAKKYSISRKTKSLDEYKSKSCASVRILERYPEKANTYIDYTYSRADVAANEASKWVMDADNCEWTNYEQLFMSQKKIFCMLLNIGFWNLANPTEMCDKILNAIRWKSFVHAELKYRLSTGKNIAMLVERGVKYTFEINDHMERRSRTKIVRGKRQAPSSTVTGKNKKLDRY